MHGYSTATLAFIVQRGRPTMKVVGPRIGGRVVAGAGSEFVVCNPATEEAVASVASASAEQFDSAILAARQSFDSRIWQRVSVEDRAQILLGMLDHLWEQRDSIAGTIVASTGCPRTQTTLTQVAMPLNQLREAIALFGSLPPYEHSPRPTRELVAGSSVGISVLEYDPVGVVSAIAPYNFPFLVELWKVIPALIAGCSVVLRPSPLTPLTAHIVGDAGEKAGLPAGVLNVVSEGGNEGALRMTTHPGVDLVSFTGSTEVGRQTMSQAAPTLKRLILELGGKSVGLYLPDAVERAAEAIAGVVRSHAGQVCSARTRVLVPQATKEAVLDQARLAVEKLRIGDPNLATTDIGPVISEKQRGRIASLVESGVECGASVVSGGRATSVNGRGYFFEPTVIAAPNNSNPCAAEEIFGPVVTVLGYRDLDDAVDMANDTVYGLGGSVYSSDVAAALGVARRIRSGTVTVNGSGVSAFVSSGGYKQSGLGRERGIEGLRAYQQVKHLAVWSGG